MRRLSRREKILLICFAVLIAVFAWDRARRIWSPKITIETDHYTIYSTATPDQTQKIGLVAEIQYAGYMKFLEQLMIAPLRHEKLKIKLFKDRKEFRLCNSDIGWMEAFYRKPYCYQYYSAETVNPYHWMMHEATHQLNAEVAGWVLPQWIDEGIATYFGSSRIIENRLALGEIDTNAYPIWWLYSIAQSGDLETDKVNTSIIPLRAIIAGQGGPNINEHFNLYYLHWWSLTHFLMHYENGKYKPGLIALLKSDCGVRAFEFYVGNIDQIERQWYEYVVELKRAFSGRITLPPGVL
ncbi:MAG: DUF1570 domain-containing protein [Nitrospirae bacterium]|nr:DUF1570 domain-containing protein [Nitrospirota bacterium]